MIQHQSYFDGHVQSLALEGHNKPITAGVMAKGEYEFGTESEELMQVVAGTLVVLLPNESTWQTFESGSEFTVPANSRFKLDVPVDTAYLCTYG